MLFASVASVHKTFGPPNASAAAKLCEMVDGFFDCLNVTSKTEHIRKRKPFLAPYTSPGDRRYVFFSLNLDDSQQANSMGLSNVHDFCILNHVSVLLLAMNFIITIEFYVKRNPFPILLSMLSLCWHV